MAASPPRYPPNVDVFAQYGLNLALHIQRLFEDESQPHTLPGPEIFPAALKALDSSGEGRKFKVKGSHPDQDGVTPVGIIGAGMAGLYTALILTDLGIPFQIIEASNRIGGRCFTHKFKDGEKYDYYDVGAMRFPLPVGDEGAHLRLKKLFESLDIRLLEYFYKNDAGILYYNDTRATIGTAKLTTFRAEELGIREEYLIAGTECICKDFIKPLAEKLLKDLSEGGHKGWDSFMDKYDKYSTRSYLQFEYLPSDHMQSKYNLPNEHLSTAVINWLETFDKSSGWYDRALTETVLEALAFGQYGPKIEWRCIDLGTSVLPEKIASNLTEKFGEGIIIKNAPVTAIRPADLQDATSPLVVTAGGKDYKFSHVISAVPIPNFGLMDTSKLNLSVMQTNAIRQLQYGPSIKIGIRFKSPWWKKHGQVGGQSFTDLPIRTIVYPSYGEKEGPASNVLIASYCWTNDAERLGNMIDANVDDLLEEAVLRNLAAVHNIDVEHLTKEYVEMFAWNWNHDPWTGGAFAFFGPGQYSYFYNALNAMGADGRLQWAGELLSVRHAWIVGALDSAWCCVEKYLGFTGAPRETIDKFHDNWGFNWEWAEPLPKSGGDQTEGDGDQPPPKSPDIPTGVRNLLFKHVLLHNPELACLD
ncbi:hypothetical protein FA15DRAFT_752962 [Coprinopsis marcescibilis]|uniref:Amine oxidase domain-containing protein n=1 Tax=Coprinopsis marcescibilis TaxID=230819 RepID=A0A5C3L832_COPMA|nr:hypothetical protein FA15DRAFT_752962 [Coprinopsis marcescibilis]